MSTAKENKKISSPILRYLNIIVVIPFLPLIFLFYIVNYYLIDIPAQFRNLWRWIDNHAPAVAAVSFLTIAGLLYVFYPEKWFGRDLMSNIFAGGIDLVFTVIFLGWILSRNERRRTKPVRYVIYIDACRILSKYCAVWSDIVKSSSVKPPFAGMDFFSVEQFEAVKRHFDATADAGGLPPAPWWQKLQNTAEEIVTGIDLIIQRYQSNIDPSLVGILKNIESSPTLMIWRNIYNIRQVLTAQGHNADMMPLFVENFLSTDVLYLRNLHENLTYMSHEFLNDFEFSPPYDISFVEAARLMWQRNDIAPLLGSARR